jgi:[NiFe] hydrogenase assembly HybE family chaperone
VNLHRSSAQTSGCHEAGAMAPAQAWALPCDAAAWVRDLETVYDEIARTRMAGLPVMNAVLRVEAIGFGATPAQRCDVSASRLEDAAGWRVDGIWGVLITPWFMNLVWRAGDALLESPAGQTFGALDLAVGHSRARVLAGQALTFIGAWDERLGAFECCSLISPMFQFADQAAAVAVAHAVLTELRAAPAGLAVQPQAASADEVIAARRRFLFGRSGATRA